MRRGTTPIITFNTDLDLDRDRNCTPNQAQRNHKTSQKDKC